MDLARGPLGRCAVAGAAVLALGGGAAACSGNGGDSQSSGNQGGSTTSPAATAPAGQGAAGLQQSFESVVEKVLPSVVEISTGNSTGSGVVYDSKGDVVTNAHVVGNATDVKIHPPTGTKELTARVIGTFPPDDLAVVRVSSDAGSLRPATFGNSAQVRIGQIVLAMGNPLGLRASVTQGIVSATGRTVGEGAAGTAEGQGGTALITSAIQTSAPINPGNSGGALVDLPGEVIGIPTLAAREPNSGGAAPGIGFAIPSDTVRNIADQLIADGRVTHSDRAALGISAETIVNAEGQPAGAGVVSVKSNGPADRAGIRADDVIVAVGGQATPSVSALQSVLAEHKPDQKVPVRVSRSGNEQTFEVTLGSLSS
jgi:putative serine protease PepD